MSVRVIIYSSDRIRGGILKEILRRNKIGTLLLENIMDVKSAISSHQPAIVIFDTSNSIKNEVNFFKRLISSIDSCFFILLGDPLIINTLHDFYQSNIHKKLFLPDPLDPEIIISTSLEIMSHSTLKMLSGQTIDSADRSGDVIPALTQPPTTAEQPMENMENNQDIEILESDLREYLKL